MKALRIVSNAVSQRKTEAVGKTLVVFGLIFSLIVLSLPAAGSAGEKYTFKGYNANAYFTNTDGCIESITFVSADDGVTHQPPGQPNPSSSALISLFRFDACANEWLMYAEGSATLADGDFTVDKKLDSATLSTTINVYDFFSDSFFDVFVDLTWTAIGGPTRSTSIQHVKLEGFISTLKYTGTGRIAEAVGFVSDGSTNFSPNPGADGFIQYVTTGDVMVLN